MSALEVTVSVVLPAPADVSALQLTGHTTGTADKTGLINVTDFVIVAEAEEYGLSFTLTDFPLVCLLMPRAHAMSVVVPTSLGFFMDHKFMHVHLCLHCTCAQLQSEGALPSLGTRLAGRECWYPSQPTDWGCPVHMGRMANMS